MAKIKVIQPLRLASKIIPFPPVHIFTGRQLTDVMANFNRRKAASIELPFCFKRTSAFEFTEQPFDYVITVCDNAKESCPVFPGKAERIHWSFDDPAEVIGNDEEKLAVFRRVRDEIRQQLNSYINQEDDG